MATLVSAVEVLRNFGAYSVLFPFILIMTFMYAVLTKYKFFGENNGINAIISMITAFLFIGFARAVTFVTYVIPILVTMFLLIILVIMAFTFLGVNPEVLEDGLTHPAGWMMILAVLVISIFLANSMTFPELSPYAAHHGELDNFVIGPAPNEVAGVHSTTYTDAEIQKQSDLRTKSTIDMMKLVYNPSIIAMFIMLMTFAGSAYAITSYKIPHPKFKG